MFDPSWEPLGVGGTTEAGAQGFSWGYLDLLDKAHNGVVVIWSFGQPFLPGTVGAGRAGRPVNPRREPSISVAVHRAGRPDFWLLQRCPAVDGAPEPLPAGGLCLGDSSFMAKPGHLEVKLDCPVPGGSRLTGRIEISGPPIQLTTLGGSRHRWGPRVLGRGTANLTAGDWNISVDGDAYHDANASSVGLERLGIRRWTWGRTPHPGGTWIHYLVEPEDAGHEPLCLWLNVDHEGQVDVRTIDVDWREARRGKWGMRAPLRYHAGAFEIEHMKALEDGPYYQRWVTRVIAPDGTEHQGTGEFVDVHRMDAGLASWLTPFAVHDPQRFSWWVPLFCGPVAGRWSRLIRHWTGG